jgi:hypothetical protein
LTFETCGNERPFGNRILDAVSRFVEYMAGTTLASAVLESTAMNGKSVYVVPPPSSPGVRSVQDEWGMFDPDQAGLKAVFRALNQDDDVTKPVVAAQAPVAVVKTPEPAITRKAPEPPARAATPATPVHIAVPPPRTGNSARQAIGASARIEEAAPVGATGDNVSEPADREPAARVTAPADRGAVYTLEFPTRCPECSTEMATVRVSRLLRTQVSFTSTLPRKGYIIVCPHCNGILSAELSGLI